MLDYLKLRRLRLALGLTPTEAADLARVSRSYWVNLEAGRKRNPSGDVLIRLARTVRADAETLVTTGHVG